MALPRTRRLVASQGRDREGGQGRRVALRSVPKVNCPACGFDGSSVLKSIDNGPDVQRRRACQCGARWTTDEVYRRGTLASISGQGKPLKASVGPPLASDQPSLAANSLGREGWGLSSGRDSGSDPIPHSGSSQQSGARARVKVNYPVAFEEFWGGTWKEGSKGAALKAWRKALQPSLIACQAAIDAYLKAKRASGQTTAHVSSWLNDSGHLQTEWHLAAIGKSNAQPAPRPAPYHAPAKPAPQLPAGVDSAAEIERWKRERDQLADAKAVG